MSSKKDELQALMMEECEKILLRIGARRTDEDLCAVCDSLNRVAAEAMREGAQTMLARTLDHMGGRVQ
jgi:hypothetical protein